MNFPLDFKLVNSFSHCSKNSIEVQRKSASSHNLKIKAVKNVTVHYRFFVKNKIRQMTKYNNLKENAILKTVGKLLQ